MKIFERIAVIDTETTHSNPTQAEIAEVAVGVFNGFEWDIKSQFFGTKDPMPFRASAVNHISRRMLEGKPLFLENENSTLELLKYNDVDYYVAHHSPYDEKVIKKAFENNNLNFDKKFICTMRLAEKLYSDVIELKNLSYLRYFFDLNVPDETIAHRADADVLVTCALYEQIVADAIEGGYIDPSLEKSINEQMFDYCWAPIEMDTFPIGKHKGQKFSEVPTDYYSWLLENSDKLKEDSDFYDIDFANAVIKELEGRLA